MQIQEAAAARAPDGSVRRLQCGNAQSDKVGAVTQKKKLICWRKTGSFKLCHLRAGEKDNDLNMQEKLRRDSTVVKLEATDSEIAPECF